MYTQVETDPDEYRRATQNPKPSEARQAGGGLLFTADRSIGGISLAAIDERADHDAEVRNQARLLGIGSESGSEGDRSFDSSDPFAMDMDELPQDVADRISNVGNGPPIPPSSIGQRAGNPLRVPEHQKSAGAGNLYTQHRFIPMAELLGEEDVLEEPGEAPVDRRPLETIPRSECFICQFDAFPLEYDGDEATIVTRINRMIENEVDEEGLDDKQIAVQVSMLYRECLGNRSEEAPALSARQALAHIRYHRNGQPLALLSKMMRDNARLMHTLDDRQWEERPDDSQPRLNVTNLNARLKVQAQTANLMKTSTALRKNQPPRKSARAAGADRLRELSRFRAHRRVPAWKQGGFERRRQALMPQGSDDGGDRNE